MLDKDIAICMLKYLDILDNREILQNTAFLLYFNIINKEELFMKWNKFTKKARIVCENQIETRINGKLHSINGEPAKKRYTNTPFGVYKIYEWYDNDKMHNKYGPAYVTPYSAKWYENGILKKEMRVYNESVFNMNERIVSGEILLFGRTFQYHISWEYILLYFSGITLGWIMGVCSNYLKN
jgi:hypothetical protein